MVPVPCLVSARGGNDHLRVESIGSISISEFGLEIKESNPPPPPLGQLPPAPLQGGGMQERLVIGRGAFRFHQGFLHCKTCLLLRSACVQIYVLSTYLSLR